MIGIVSYGGYLPRLRLKRMSIFQEMAGSPGYRPGRPRRAFFRKLG